MPAPKGQPFTGFSGRMSTTHHPLFSSSTQTGPEQRPPVPSPASTTSPAGWGGRQWDCHSAGRTFSEASVHLMRSSLGRKLGTPKASAHLQENDRYVGVWDRVPQIHREQGVGAEILPGETKPPHRRGRIQGASPLPQELGLLSSLSLPFACLRYSVLIRTNREKMLQMAKPLSAPSSPSGEAHSPGSKVVPKVTRGTCRARVWAQAS